MLPRPTLLITTKLHPPSLRPNWVERPALLTRLDAGLAHTLTLISAPAGFGKTTLASQWIERCTEPAAWLSLDPHDNEPTQFLRYFIAAVRTCVPGACPTTYDLLGTAQLPAVAYLADSLLGELAALPQTLLLVLDDYHHIRSPEVHGIIHHLLRYLPSTLHLVFLTRFDPPLHLGRLRVAQQINELRAGDLRFSTEETHHFLRGRLHQSMVAEMTGEIVETLRARTNGWITGLELASISLQQQNANDVSSHFRGSDQFVVNYLMDEVMAHVPEELQRFLLQISLVDRFCAPLADALVADDAMPISSYAAIAQLEEMNLFVVALDNERTWYRFHDLFREFLLFELKRNSSPDDLVRLHRRASAWFADVGLIEDALRHALAADDDEYAAHLLMDQIHSMMNRQVPIYILRRWLELFTEETIQAHPGLLLAQVNLAAFGVGTAFSPHLFTQIETLIQNTPGLTTERRQSLQADLDLLRGIFEYARDDPQRAEPYLQRAVVTLPRAHEFYRAQAIIHLAAVYFACGEQRAGHALLDSALAEASAQQSPTMLILMGSRAINLLYAGELPRAQRTLERILAEGDARHAYPEWQGVGFVDVWLGRAHYLRGIICYEQNDLDAAARHWSQVETFRYRTHPAPYHDSLIGKALIAHLQGAPDEARGYAQAAQEFATEVRNPSLLAKSEALWVRLALHAGNTAEALERSQYFTIGLNQGTTFGLTLPVLTRIAALLHHGAPDSLRAAQQLAATCLARAHHMHNTHQIIQVLALQALIDETLGRAEEALDTLAQALDLAEPGGFLRTFLDLGKPLADLLREFAIERGTSAYLSALLAAFDQTLCTDSQHDLTAEYAKRYGITPLTPREREVLALVSQRLTQAEIADALVISISTVKNHTHNIYSKLGVRSGRQAVTKARTVGILPAE